MEELIFYSTETILLLLYIYYLVWEYSAKDVPLYVKVLTYFSWLMTFSIVLILPIDISNAARQSDENLYDQTNDSLFVMWRVLYWCNFLLSWIILPFFQDFEDSGEFTLRSKTVYSIRKNLTIYTVGLILGIVLVLYLAIRKHLSFTDIEGVLAGLGNFFGLLLVVILLGYGLVAIPKRYIRESNEQAMLDQAYRDAALLQMARTEKVYELEELTKNLMLLQREYHGTEYDHYLGVILKRIPKNFQESMEPQMHQLTAANIAEKYKPLTMKLLAELNRGVKRLMFDLERVQTKFQVIIDRANKLEKRYAAPEDLAIASPNSSFYRNVTLRLAMLWNLRIRKYYHQYIGYIFSVISALLMLSELCVFINPQVNLNLYNLLLSSVHSFYLMQLFLIVPLTYMMFCTYYGLFAMKISGLISFNRNHHTDAPSLMFGSINFGRVSFPLCYNFISLTQLEAKTQYEAIVGNMAIFGSSFKTVLPLMLLIMCFFNLFNIGDKIFQAIGLSQYAAQEEQEGLLQEGKKILEKEREYRARTKNLNSPQQHQSRRSTQQELAEVYPQQPGAIKNFNEILNI